MPMTAASMFWLDALQDYKIDHLLPLPFDRYRLHDEHRTGRGISVSFDLGQKLSHACTTLASSINITVEQLTLACYFAFLFKLTNGETDLCVGVNTDGRYKEELLSVIGMFVNVIPLRCHLNPHWSFHQLVRHVAEITTQSLQYSYFPLQRILAQHPNVVKPTFLDTSFEFRTFESENTKKEVTIGDARICATPISIMIAEDEIINKFDFILTVQYDSDAKQLSCNVNASVDLFHKETVQKIAQRFHSMLEQLFNVPDVFLTKPIYHLSLVLPDEKLLMRSMNNTQTLFPPVRCIHHEFVLQAMKHSQKIAVELDDQSLTYCELLYYAQLLSLNLVKKQRVIEGDIVCQCVERSLSMVSQSQKNQLIR